ncbi:MAG: Rne/Rng family ribonuclease [Desulfovibrionaceae bacterium]|nr:Rne/Rng family ribonuclease [Desulfovibrionaceae bacterium]
MLVSVLPGELAEVVFIEDGTVAEYYVEMVHQAKIRGNIYKGVISNIDPNLQAAFVNFGQSKNGFLQIDEIHPEYWLTHYEPENGSKYPPIQKVMKAGQEVLVQVVKEPNGSKGAFLTTWVSLAGRFLVLTPGQEQIGISRKVEDHEERSRLRELIKGLDPGEGVGAIVRTVSEGTSKTTLQKDLNFLKRVWQDIRKRAGTEKAPSLIYAEPGLASRAVRDYLSDDVSEIWVDDAETAEAIRDMTSLLFPRRPELVHYYEKGSKSLWDHFNVRKQLDQIHAREVTLPSGGRLVFDQTEALMAIDINSGKSGGKNNFEATALRTNLEAAESIARQLRLRDVGGQIVIDFIEMRDQGRCREVEKTLHAAMKNDRARHDIGHMSSFGLLQIVRQRIGSSAISISQEPCPHCGGTGMRRNLEWQALQLLRELRGELTLAARSGRSEHICTLNAELALYVLNNKRERLSALEKEFNIRLEIRIARDGGE